ncbi:TetR/AcrR family transcriptional regulator [Microbacterium sp. B19]|uniref:TetR/AcrR family transcriptional regulator n=1 Tax=Microbacterium sp. B19 TaxID=96765 RepID=UPI000346ECD2|nr:TetR/AcrR family transcriptional regulator [Microbacterium sp. B19]
MTTAPEKTATEAPRLGRKRDLSRDPEILEAALDVLAETGFERMTIDEVATRARAGKATLYRRWPSKSELVIDAVACMKRGVYDLAALPDTGTLRGDLVAMIKEPSIADAQRKMQVMAGIVSMLSRSPELAEVAEEALVAPRREANRVLIERAVARGEVTDAVDVDLISSVGSAMVAQRLLVERKPVTRAFLLSIIDGIVLPALGLRAAD